MGEEWEGEEIAEEINMEMAMDGDVVGGVCSPSFGEQSIVYEY